MFLRGALLAVEVCLACLLLLLIGGPFDGRPSKDTFVREGRKGTPVRGLIAVAAKRKTAGQEAV